MQVDLLIKNGKVIDPSRGFELAADIAVKNGRIVSIENEKEIIAKRVLDASGYIVTPGLIDSHAHVFYKGSDLGIPADLTMLPYGVTAVGEGGSCGVSNFESFLTLMASMRMRYKMLLNVSPTGLGTLQHPETLRPETWNRDQFYRAFDLYGDKLMGLKLRVSDEVVNDSGLRILEETLKLAELLKTRVSVHVTATSINQGELISLLRDKDIYCHVYQGYGETIFDQNGEIYEAFNKARKRGVIFDAASGKNNFSFDIAKKAMEREFYPDVICSDISSMNYLTEYLEIGLPYMMSKFLALGMKFSEILKRTTVNPAKLMGMEDQIGSLKVGAFADIAIFKIKEGSYKFIDAKRQVLMGNQMIIPMATVQNGELIYKNMEW